MIDSMTWFFNGIMYYSEIFKSIGAMGTMVAAIVAFFKYKNEKDKELYLKRLNEVYAPLYGFLVRQETIRKLCAPATNIKDFPIFKIVNTKSKVKFNVDEDYKIREENEKVSEKKEQILNNDDLITILDNVNQSLVNPKLLFLLNQYKILLYLEDNIEEKSEQWEKVTKQRVDIEYELFIQINKGYEHIIKKLGIDNKNEFEDLSILNKV